MAEEREKMRWPDGDTGVWVTFPDATCLMVDAFKGDGSEFFYRLTVLGETAQKKYYASYNFHRTVQRAFDNLASGGHQLKDIKLHFRKLPEGNKKYWLICDEQVVLANSIEGFEVSEAAQARVKDKRKNTDQPTGQQPAPPPARGQPAPPGPPAQPAPPGQTPGPNGTQAAAGQASSSSTPQAYLKNLAHRLRCFKLAEALLHSEKLTLDYTTEDVRATANSMSIDLGRLEPTEKMVDEAEAMIAAHAEKLKQGQQENQPQAAGMQPAPALPDDVAGKF